MQLEQPRELHIGGRYVAIGADGAQRSIPDLDSESAISIAQRQLNPHIHAFLEEVDFSRLGSLRLAGSAATVYEAIFEKLRTETAIPPILARWLCDDIGGLIQLFGKLTKASAFLVRLEVISSDGCTRFHADNVGYRMVTTYVGPGTQWIAPPYVKLPAADDGVSTDEIQQLGAGWIALMRGRKAETELTPAILHRSPPMPVVGQPRLFLAIDDLSDHSLVAADNL